MNWRSGYGPPGRGFGGPGFGPGGPGGCGPGGCGPGMQRFGGPPFARGRRGGRRRGGGFGPRWMDNPSEDFLMEMATELGKELGKEPEEIQRAFAAVMEKRSEPDEE